MFRFRQVVLHCFFGCFRKLKLFQVAFGCLKSVIFVYVVLKFCKCFEVVVIL